MIYSEIWVTRRAEIGIIVLAPEFMEKVTC